MLYTDHIIYSPEVPFFRDGRGRLVMPVTVSVITCPAPNAKQALRRDPLSASQIAETLERRAAKVLAIAAAHSHRSLILGAWGCGVFGNDPAQVAGVFAEHLQSSKFARAFERVVFAVHDHSSAQLNWHAFARQFGSKT
jgi:uncharacterized protein (TIGR02452 family)